MRSVLVGSFSLLPLLAACSGADGNGNTGTAAASAQPSDSTVSSSAAASGSGAAFHMSAGGAAAGGTTGASNSGASHQAGSSSATTMTTSTTAASPGAAGATMNTAGNSASAGAAGAAGANAATPAMMGNIECNGKPWPARAQGGYGPFPVGPESAGLPAYWPTQDWKMEDPDKLGFDAAKLAEAVDFTIPQTTNQAVLVIRHGYIAAEKYFAGFTQSTQHESFSVAKSFTSGLMGIAIAEGKVPGLDTRICEYYDEWDCNDTSDPRSRITIDHALNLETGLQWSENWRSDATGINDGILTSLDTVLARPSVEEPGVRQRYSTGDPALMSGIIQKATGMTALAYAKAKVFDVIGTPGIRWNSDNKGRTTTYAGLQATAREYAKYGYLYLNNGKWDGQQVVPEDYVKKSTQLMGGDPCKAWVQYLWHVNPPTRLGIQPKPCAELFCQPTEYVDLPQDAFFAEGVQGQYIYVMPSSDLVIVRLGQDAIAAEVWDDYSRGFLMKILDAIKP